ncbi:MAG: nuclear transport factor 2 family protein [Sphingomonadaceae bacterium]|nr:nuclear transport factor 2 family protein [Sphingomonadaceae bacterium]
MGTRDIVEAFVGAINSGKAERIVNLMDRNAVFVDALGDRLEGRDALLAGWGAYLRLFPDYRIEIEATFVDEPEAMLHGWAGATLHRGGRPADNGGWRIPAAWRAVTDARRVLLWQVYADNQAVRALLERQP